MDRTKIVLLATAAVILSFSGCSLQTKVPPTSKYLLNVSDERAASSAEGCREKVLRIGLVESPSLLNTLDIVYETDSGRSYSYTRARWMASVNEQLSTLLARSITRQKTFKDVIALKSFAKNDLLLETDVYAFSQTIHADGSSTLKVSVKFVLLEQYRRNIVASTLVEMERKDVDGNIDEAVKGYSQMTDELLDAVNRFLEESCAL